MDKNNNVLKQYLYNSLFINLLVNIQLSIQLLMQVHHHGDIFYLWLPKQKQVKQTIKNWHDTWHTHERHDIVTLRHCQYDVHFKIYIFQWKNLRSTANMKYHNLLIDTEFPHDANYKFVLE